MEADSTTYENISRKDNRIDTDPSLPFSTCTENLKIYQEFLAKDDSKCLENRIVERMQNFGLLAKTVRCPTTGPECQVACKSARVVDRVQWVCEGCGKRQPIRTGSFFLRLPCSLLQALQIILAWCEDADYEDAALHFGVKSKAASLIYDKLDEVAIKEYQGHRLGGPDSVVLAGMYPACLARQSPDTTAAPDRPPARILMLADTNHVPTYYRLHMIREDHKKNKGLTDEELQSQVETLVRGAVRPGSLVVRAPHAPAPLAAPALADLAAADTDLLHFLSTRIWRQAITLCNAARDEESAGAAGGGFARGPQRYLQAALHRLRHPRGYYPHILRLVACDVTTERDTAGSRF